MTRRTRSLRYGASTGVALVGVACGALIPGTGGGTAATVLIGIGLVGIVSLVFYEVGLTEDRERASNGRRGDVTNKGRPSSAGGENRASEHRGGEDPAGEHRGGEYRGGRLRSLERRRGQRRRLR